jgi:diaminohydroxyphosphoribosylaminopyrimidine deaminase/5-amino-6-(5-phosphoribosylamino)uracil reductase
MIMKSHLWQNILQLAQLAKSQRASLPLAAGVSLKTQSAFLQSESSQPIPDDTLLIGIFQDPPSSTPYRCRLETGGWITFLDGWDAPAELKKKLCLYVPLALSPFLAHRQKKALAIAHFAQTLDGKIATNSGASKWIGNEANLLHAHRMRALCDAILVGTNTVRQDQPKLTVRKVAGTNPLRVVLGKSRVDYSSLLESSPDPILLLGAEHCPDHPQLRSLQSDPLDCPWSGSTILEMLYQEGISSVLIEGGPKTTSSFLNDRALHLIQLHLAPMIFGSGRNCVELPEILEVQDGLSFQYHFFSSIGNGQMFTGYLA